MFIIDQYILINMQDTTVGKC